MCPRAYLGRKGSQYALKERREKWVRSSPTILLRWRSMVARLGRSRKDELASTTQQQRQSVAHESNSRRHMICWCRQNVGGTNERADELAQSQARWAASSGSPIRRV